MKVKIVFAISVLLCFCSCFKKEEDDSDLYFFHYSYKVDGREYDVYQGRPGRGWGNGYYNSGNSFDDVYFYKLSYIVSDDISQKFEKDDNIIMFDFFYRLGNYGVRWFVNAPYIKDGEKNYFSQAQSFLKERNYVEKYPQIWSFSGSNGVATLNCFVVSGWMSFTRHVDDPDIILRVDYDVVFESKYPQYGERWATDTTYLYHVTDGRIDFTTKMAGRIMGGGYLK